MKEAKISEIKNHFTRYLDLVRKGQIVRVYDRDVPVAHIVPIAEVAQPVGVGAEALTSMERKGLIRRGTGKMDREILDRDPAGKPCGVLAALLEERQGRSPLELGTWNLELLL